MENLLESRLGLGPKVICLLVKKRGMGISFHLGGIAIEQQATRNGDRKWRSELKPKQWAKQSHKLAELLNKLMKDPFGLHATVV